MVTVILLYICLKLEMHIVNKIGIQIASCIWFMSIL